MTPITIPINKTKATRMFIFFVLFIFISALLVTRPEIFVHGKNYGFVKIVGYICTVIFVLAATIVSNKVFKRTPGLQIDRKGITDNSLGVLFPTVRWEDITGLKKMHGAGENFITIMISDPETYINSEPNSVKRKMLELNYRSLKTPVNIAIGRLKTDPDELYHLIVREFEKQKQP